MSGTYTQEELTALAIGELDETRAAEIEQLLAGDAEGRRMVDELRGVAGLLSDQFAAEPLPELTAAQRMASLLKKPAKGGMPAIANVLISIGKYVIGIRIFKPPILRISCCSCIPWITLPEARNRQALKKA